MKMLLALAFVLVALGGPVAAFQPATQDDFVPAGSLPPAETLPAAPMVVAAYAFVWVAVFVYVAFLWRRLQRVERELSELERRVAER
jgi:CcmD family protein